MLEESAQADQLSSPQQLEGMLTLFQISKTGINLVLSALQNRRLTKAEKSTAIVRLYNIDLNFLEADTSECTMAAASSMKYKHSEAEVKLVILVDFQLNILESNIISVP